MDEKLPELLRLSGRQGFFCAPRGLDRSPDERYKVIFLGGLTLEEARTKLREVPQHFGLVRSKRGFGVRVAEMTYAEIKQLLLPGAPVSSDSDEAGPRRFKVMGLPTKVDRSQVKKILRAFNWLVKVQTWSVVAKSGPSTRTFRFEDATIVISEDFTTSQQCLVGAGFKGAWKQYARVQETQPVVAAMNASGVAASSGSTSDDTAKRFAQLEGQMATIRSEQKTAEQKTAVRIEEIAKRTDGLDGKVDQLQQTVGGFASIVQQQLSVAFEKFTQANDEKLDRFTQTHQEALRRVETAGEERLKEMQELFSVSPKVRKVEKKDP